MNAINYNCPCCKKELQVEDGKSPVLEFCRQCGSYLLVQQLTEGLSVKLQPDNPSVDMRAFQK